MVVFCLGLGKGTIFAVHLDEALKAGELLAQLGWQGFLGIDLGGDDLGRGYVRQAGGLRDV